MIARSLWGFLCGGSFCRGVWYFCCYEFIPDDDIEGWSAVWFVRREFVGRFVLFVIVDIR